MDQQELRRATVCPACSKMKRPEHPLCGTCHDRYTEEAVKTLLSGKALAIDSWAATHIKERIEEQRAEFDKLRAEHQRIVSAANESTDAFIASVPNVAILSEEVVRTARTQKHQELYDAAGGRVKFREMKLAEQALANLQASLLPEATPIPNTHPHLQVVPEASSEVA